MTNKESTGDLSLFLLSASYGQSETSICLPELRLRHLSLAGAVLRLRRVERAGRGGWRDGIFGKARPEQGRAHDRTRIARCREQDARADAVRNCGVRPRAR